METTKLKAKNIHQAEELLRAVSEGVSDLVVVVDSQGKRLYANPPYMDLFENSDSLMGTEFFREVHPDDRKKVREYFNEVVKNGAGKEVEHRLILPDGNSRILKSRGIAVRDGGNPEIVVIVSSDVTAGRHSEKEISLLAQAVSCTRDAFCLTDMGDNLLFVNPSFCETYGYAEEELIGKNIGIVRSPSVSREVNDRLRQATLRGGWNGELLNRRKDGTEFPVEVWTSTVRNDAGEPVAMVGVTRDVSDRFHAEENLRKTTERLQLLVDNIDVVTFELDPAGIFLLSRGKGLEKLKLLPDQVVGHSVFDVYADNPKIVESMKKALGGIQVQVEVEAGGYIWSTVVIPLKDARGNVEYVFGTAIDITELKRAEEALIGETDLFHALMDNIPDALFCKDIRSRFTRINRAQAGALGIDDPQEAIGKTDADFLPFERALKAYADEQDIIRTGNQLVGKLEKISSQGGDERWLSTTKVPIRGKDSNIVGIVGSSRDITELKQAEELESALYKIAETTRSSADMQNFYSAVHKTIGELMFAKNFYIALYDEKEDLLTFPYFADEVDVPAEPGVAGHGLTAYVLRTGKPLLCGDGLAEDLARKGEADLVGVPAAIWLGVPLVADGKTIGAMVVQHYSDPRAYGEREQHILEFVSSQVAKAILQKRSEEALRFSEEKYRTLFEESQDCILLSTPEGKLLDVNPAGLKLFGYASKGELLKADSARDLYLNAGDRDIFKTTLETEGYVRDLEFSIKRKDGDKRVVLESSSAVRDDRGNIIAYRSFLRDITERKRLEDQLRQAQKMEGIGTLAGGIAHDFNNLLGIILGYTSILESGGVQSEKLSQSLDTIKNAVQRGADLVRQLLTFARKSDPSFDSVNVNDTVAELVKMLGQTFPKTIRISAQLGDNMPDIIADASQLHQALLNLCVNSRDAIIEDMPGSPGAGTLLLRTGRIDGSSVRQKFANAAAADYMFIGVQDTGAGMDETTKRRIFEPFFTTKERGKGTGLGLAVVYGVINSHHGFVEVESEKGKGTTFTLYFPVSSQVVAAVRKPAEPSAAGTGGSETILVVEDETLLADLLKTILQDRGYEVLVAHDGQEGFEIYQQNPDRIQLILSDMGLPRLGGYEMFLRMKEKNPKVKAILASGYFDPNLKMDLIKEGAKDFIQKPYVSEIVLRRIREVLDEKSG